MEQCDVTNCHFRSSHRQCGPGSFMARLVPISSEAWKPTPTFCAICCCGGCRFVQGVMGLHSTRTG